MRILITGSHGFVGSRALQTLRGEHSLSVLPGQLAFEANADSLLRFVTGVRPELIVHAAAISDVGTCQRDPEASHRANVELTCGLAAAARRTGAKLVAFSSDQVYTGCEGPGPYTEADACPANVYGSHKLEAEQRALELDPTAVFLRATWMYDMPAYGLENRGNFIVNLLKTALRGERLNYSTREYRGITYVRQVVQLLPALIDVPGGAYNYGSENPLSMYETAVALYGALKLDAARFAAPTDDARHNLWFSNAKLRAAGLCFDTTAEGIARCVGDYGLSC